MPYYIKIRVAKTGSIEPINFRVRIDYISELTFQNIIAEIAQILGGFQPYIQIFTNSLAKMTVLNTK